MPSPLLRHTELRLVGPNSHRFLVTFLVSIVTVVLLEWGKAMENQHADFGAPTAANVTVAMKRPREYLKEPEIERLMEAARQNRHGHRDATAILLAYRHGLRASELVGLRWDDFDLIHYDANREFRSWSDTERLLVERVERREAERRVRERSARHTTRTAPRSQSAARVARR